MSGSKPPPRDPDPPDSPAPEKPGERKSGRVSFDERGNAVWEWSMSTGIFGRNVDTKRLRKLEANDLKIAEESAPTTGKGAGLAAPKPAGGFDPYNSSGGPPRWAAPKAAVPATKPKDLKRLSAWIQQQKALGKKTDEE